MGVSNIQFALDFEKWSERMCYLLSWIKEAAVWCLELTLTKSDSFLGSNALGKTSWFALAEAERVDSVRAREEIGISWILLYVFPASVRPSAWYQLQVFLRNASLGLQCLWSVLTTTWSEWSTSSLVSSAVIRNVIARIVFCLHFYFNFCILYY